MKSDAKSLWAVGLPLLLCLFSTSAFSSDIELNILGPNSYEFAEEKKNIYLHCRIKNTGKADVTIMPKARIFMKNKSKEYLPLKKYSSGPFKAQTLSPGGHYEWWQHGVAPGEGTFTAIIKWDSDESVVSKEATIVLKESGIQSSMKREKRDAFFQSKIDDFPEVKVGTDPVNVRYENITFDKGPLLFDGGLYNCIKFTTPETPGTLVWSFVLKDHRHNQMPFYILPSEGFMTGFTHFDIEMVNKDVPGHAEKGDSILLQTLSKSKLEPSQTYIIWFEGVFKDIPSVRLSINVLEKSVSPKVLFKEFLERPDFINK